MKLSWSSEARADLGRFLQWNKNLEREMDREREEDFDAFLGYERPPDLPRHRSHIPLVIQRAVRERDRNACVLCGTAAKLSLDHIERYRDGGADTVDNLRVLCMPCNVARG